MADLLSLITKNYSEMKKKIESIIYILRYGVYNYAVILDHVNQ